MESLPCKFCTRVHPQWERFLEDVDDMLPLAIKEAVKCVWQVKPDGSNSTGNINLQLDGSNSASTSDSQPNGSDSGGKLDVQLD